MSDNWSQPEPPGWGPPGSQGEQTYGQPGYESSGSAPYPPTGSASYAPQPGQSYDPAGWPVQGAAPENYLVWSILATVFCCVPAGVASIVFASQVNSKWNQGDVAGARQASKNARLWALISVGGGIVGGIITAVLQFATLSAQ